MINKKNIIIGIFILFLITNISVTLKTEGLSHSKETINLNYIFSEPEIEYINNEGQTTVRFRISGLSNTHDYLKPCLPVKPLRILVPYGEKIDNIEVISSDQILLGFFKNIEITGPLVPIVTINNNTYNKEILVCSENYKDLCSNIGTYKNRGFSILHLNLYPIKYDIDTGEVSYFNNIQIKIKTIPSENKVTIRGLPQDFEKIKNIIENPSYIEAYETFSQSVEKIQSYEYIIITSEKFKNANVEYNFEDLIQSKINKGLTAGIFTVEDIVNNENYGVFSSYGDANPENPFYETEITKNTGLFDDSAARIRNFIRYAYSELGTNYVLLAGDADEIVQSDYIVPYRGLFADEDGLPLQTYGILEHEEDDIPSDIYYACLDGNFNYDCDLHFGEAPKYCDDGETDEADLYSEVWVGRACVDSVEEISNFVMKTLYYEQSNDEYLSKILFIGEYLGFPGVSAYGGNYKDYVESKITIPDSYDIFKIYDRDEEWHSYELIPHLSENPYHIINHDGHGNHYYILKTNGDVIREFNNDKPFFLYSHSCLTGSFDNYNCWYGYQNFDCIAEVLTCEIPYGAFACILNARFGLGSEGTLESPSGAYDESFFKAIFEENIREIGRANHYSKEYYINQIDENGMRWTYYQTNLFGDPEIKIKNHNNAPNKPTINGITKGEAGLEYDYTITTTDPDGDEIYYWILWYDGCPGVTWDGPYYSGEEVIKNNSWNANGEYTIKVKAKDVDGLESEWVTLKVTMPKTRPINGFNPFLFRLIQRFPILKYIL